MVNPTTAGWTCAQCGWFVGVDQSHTCPTGPIYPVAPVFSVKPIRYRVRGRISPVGLAGTYYDVDLVVEAIP